ncbi:SAM-dependent methyltransferase [Ereboglobus luteus]|uniref:rRNA methyltransferase n=1 Tax=Ereboglobus luteus TaxID=1796921 RepID=A0A2U8E5H2_9BACT|nr:SAM-dependent methyltransferase [Ereboglobus luteus]AWI10189.1 rRNA methyltransferase [Ereboglobus luteus]
MILRCQPGYELLLERELRPHGLAMGANGGGWLATANTQETENACPDLCFAHSALLAPREITGESVNALAARIAEYFLESARTERFDAQWPLAFDCAANLDGLGRRADAVEKAFNELLRKRMSRVAKLAALPSRLSPFSPSPLRGLFVYFTDFQRAHVARESISYGQRRMADDPLAPSRSYLKVEEAYGVIGREPAPGETVVDLGAAPGGWSYSAAKRGARVVAVDNGPLKAGALNNPLITHLQQDAFHFDPTQSDATSNAPADWLFCDLVEDPRHVLENILLPWVERRWCKHYIVNLKFGRTDPVALLSEARARIPAARIRHLYHDREEFTLVASL